MRLREGSIRAFSLDNTTTAQVVVDGTGHFVRIKPGEVTELRLEAESQVVAFSRKGDALLTISYEGEPVTVSEGHGVLVDLAVPKETVSCAIERLSGADLPVGMELITPPRKSWLVFAPLGALVVLLLVSRRRAH